MKKSPIAQAASAAFTIDTQDDHTFLDDKVYHWGDLQKLLQELGNSVVSFLGQVNAIVHNPEVTSNLGDKSAHFYKLVKVFFSDMEEFSGKVKTLREQHENLTGPITNLNEFNLYNRIAINYHALFTELSTLVAPTISDIVLTVAEATKNTTAVQDITDVQTKA